MVKDWSLVISKMQKELRELVSLTKQYIRGLKDSGVTSIPLTNPRQNALEDFYDEIKNCQKCPLGKTRTNFVFGEGDPQGRLVFVGEAPGYDEDQQGRPFVGRAGQLLNRIIKAMGLKREDVYICNVLKCRPPGNRPPLPDEISACKPYLITQLSLLRNKKVICCLGYYSAKAILGLDLLMKDMRGNWYEYEGIPVMVTYHPAYLLRNPKEKKTVWLDMKKVMECLQK